MPQKFGHDQRQMESNLTCLKRKCIEKFLAQYMIMKKKIGGYKLIKKSKQLLKTYYNRDNKVK